MTQAFRLRHIAIHIAGQAVARVRLGLAKDAIRINTRDGALGTAEGRSHVSVWDAGRAVPATIAYCSGYAALIAAGYCEHVAVFVAWDDLEKAIGLAASWDLPGEIGAWKAQAVDLMCRRANVAAVALVAQHLLEHREMDADSVARLINIADGDGADSIADRSLGAGTFTGIAKRGGTPA
jgi:hypothetical protein